MARNLQDDPTLTSLPGGPPAWLRDFPPRVRERLRLHPPSSGASANASPVGSADAGRDVGPRDRVVYWMHHAMRARENPALDAAILVARSLRLPLLVYQGLTERYPFASARHHTFILEGARDVAADLAERGVAYAFHLERPGHRGPVLKDLARRAAVVVTEEVPTAPFPGFAEAVRRDGGAPVVTVDTACVVPMRTVDRAYERAFEFRDATEDLRRERVDRPWDDVASDAELAAKPAMKSATNPAMNAAAASLSSDPGLPFEPVDLERPIDELVASCAIDPLVGPVPHTRGGTRAGMARWRRFLDERCDRYARDRNDPLRRGVSRMSPYLHYGMVSAMRLAREASAKGGGGATKLLDELLIWREVAHAYCFHEPEHESFDALPRWARDTLEAHESDPRPAVLSWETLARGRTGDALWDAAQRSLLVHGELHNNVRMTWGKAILPWSETARGALERLIDLNHRYALDGRDPASYGGLLWCLGQFDRPFTPERPVFGSVRARSTEAHAERLDPRKYERFVVTSEAPPEPRVAVIGASLAGLVCARALADHDLPVVVIDSGPVQSLGEEDAAAPNRPELSPSDPTRPGATIDRWFASWRDEGWLDGDPGDAVRRIASRLAEDLYVRFETRVASLRRDSRGIRLGFDDPAERAIPAALREPFDAVFVGRSDPERGLRIEDAQGRPVDLAVAPGAPVSYDRDRGIVGIGGSGSGASLATGASAAGRLLAMRRSCPPAYAIRDESLLPFS